MKRYFRNLKKKIAVKNYVYKYVAGVRFLMKNGYDVDIKDMSGIIIHKRESQ